MVYVCSYYNKKIRKIKIYASCHVTVHPILHQEEISNSASCLGLIKVEIVWNKDKVVSQKRKGQNIYIYIYKICFLIIYKAYLPTKKVRGLFINMLD